jgi:flagellar biosynthesis/type III secretory pathway M-ring protein FliF/YscJ
MNKKLLLLVAAAAVIIAAAVVMSITKPPMEELVSRISPELIETAGRSYSETTNNYFIFNIARG